MKLVIRADASAKIGAGHVMRCLSLAQAAMARGWEATMVSRDLAPGLRKRVETAGCRLVSIAQAHPHPDDLAHTLEAARQSAARWIVVDGYDFDAGYHAALRASGARVMVVDDHRHRDRYPADILFNQNIHAERLVYPADPGTVFLLGPRYALLGPAFLPWRDRPRDIPETARRVLVSMGGADPDNATATVMDGLKDLDVEVKVIAGSVNAHVEKLREKCSEFGLQVSGSRPHPSLFTLLHDVTDMPALMTWADLAILGAGSTCWEAAFMGLPSLMVVLADNQRGVAGGLAEEGVGVNLGEGTDLRPEAVADQVGALLRDPERRRRMREAGRALVDGRGAARVVDTLGADRVRLRPITMDDAELLLRWTNDPDTRAVSFSSHVIAREEHYAWLARRLADPDTRMVMAEDESGRPFGQVRFEMRNGEKIVSVNLAPEARGRRLSSFAIAAATAETARLDPPARIHAYIKTDNERSLRAFLAAGYRPAARGAMGGEPSVRLVWEAGTA
ncbi:MAG: UDP-2,4-diacetamido-2,4,6-trideoxy-beta-L-altropyranose hydrolase [Kiritimatiellae bacterium]|nr:UDP-2,4-diacetamido-2,4,6-trideoxy-beta-L-altropyranose hydrolase [Kiritimatiellia bacterium]